MVACYLLLLAAATMCQPCHPAQAGRQPVSAHALALRPVAQTELAKLLDGVRLRERSGVEYEYTAASGQVNVTIRGAGDPLIAPLEWAFGSGVQAFTPLARYNGRYYEHRVSWYRQPGQAARTTGHLPVAPRTPEEAVGRLQDAATVYRCFNCHATNVRPGPDLSAMQPGIHCERCHGPGEAHAAKPERANIRAFTKLSARASIAVCAECHRMPAAGAAGSDMPELDDPGTVRFQPVGLTASRCFQKSQALACVTCHNPHEDASREVGFYVARCLGCHAASTRAGARCRRATKQNCLPCHMPRSSPMPYLTFTDHRIRVSE